MSKVLFILKRREDFNPVKHNKIGLSTGLYNSASFVNQMLRDSGIESNLEVVIDNNDIDREVTKYRPTHVIIEALWVVPTKFAVLCKLHPKVKWIIRLHSEMPFLANEGMALDWIGDYAGFKNLIIGVNAPRAMEDVKFILGYKYKWSKEEVDERVIYLPNYYPQDYKQKTHIWETKEYIDIGCFGAVRPLKNHVLQAIAAVKFAQAIGKKLKFHINSGRIEMKGEPVVHNLRGFFSHLSDEGHLLINHEWCPREEFLEVCGQMDIGMQVSFSETFNIVGADLISQGVPLVGSREIPWLSRHSCASPTETEEIYYTLMLAYQNPFKNVEDNQNFLTEYTSKTRSIWDTYFK